jgi:hypothetical protein
MLAPMRWHRWVLLLALAGCGGEVACPLIGCVSQLTVRLPAGVTSATACVEGVCTSAVVDGSMQVPLGRRTEGTSAAVTVTLPGAPAYEGTVPLTRTRPNGPNCPPDCVNGEASVDLDRGRVVPVRG